MFLVACLATAAGLCAQETATEATTFRQVENPFQEGFEYTLGETLSPRVSIGEARFLRLLLEAKKDVRSGKSIPTVLEVEFENTGTENLEALVIILFEDGLGNPLHRIENPPFKVKDGTIKSSSEKFNIQGDVLLAMKKLYLFCEIRK